LPEAAGSIEIVGVVLQIHAPVYVHPNINLEDPNPELPGYGRCKKFPCEKDR
jgi:hypothetical protein